MGWGGRGVRRVVYRVAHIHTHTHTHTCTPGLLHVVDQLDEVDKIAKLLVVHLRTKISSNKHHKNILKLFKASSPFIPAYITFHVQRSQRV